MPPGIPRSNRRAIYGIMAALSLWGAYLSVGATGWFVQRSLFDPRKSLIVFSAMAMFLGSWAIVLWAGGRPAAIGARADAGTDRAHDDHRVWSRWGVGSLSLSAIGLLVWAGVIASWPKLGPMASTLLGWLAALVLGASVVASLVALSDPRPRRGKVMGWAGMLLFMLAAAGYFFRG